MASSRLKGITVEIGGDTTKLDKALKGTNQTISSTQKSLKDVEKLLKLDPTNVELLEQKQRLLAEAASATSSKLETLKKAAEQADDALARGKAYEAKYEPLKASLDAVGTRLDELKSKQSDMEAQLASGKLSTEEYERYTKTLQDTQAEFDSLKKAKVDLDEEFRGTKIDQSQYDALQRELAETEEAAKDAQKAFKEFKPSLVEFGAAAEETAKKADKVYESTKLLSAGAAVAATGLISMAVKAGVAADDLNTLAKQSGFSTQTIQQWQFASDLVDVSVDTMVSAATKLKKNMTSTSKDVQEAWAKVGYSAYDQYGKLRDVEEVFYAVLKGLSYIPNETERDIVAMTLFGKKADELAGIIDDGGEALKALGQQAMDAGLILSQDALDGANAFNDGIDLLKAKASAAFMEAGAKLAENLLPVLSDLVDIMSRVIEFIGNLDARVLKFILTITLIVATIAPIAKTISAISNAVSGVTKVAGLFSATAGNSVYLTFAKWALIIVAVVAAVTALIAVIGVLTGKGDEMSRTLNSVGNVGSSVGGMGKARTGSSYSSSIGMDSVAAGLPGFANGGVFMPNHPVVGVLGDNRSETEIAAPESALRAAFADVLDSRAAATTKVTINFTGSLAQLGRVLQPVVTAETSRQGPSLGGK